MSKARDISNLFSASTDVATDAEVNSAIANHAANTTNRHYKAGNTASRPGSPNVGDIYTNTETGFVEIYESTGWSTVGAIASAPSSVVATNQGSGRAFNNGQASVAFSAGTIAGKTYTVTSSPGSYTNTGSSSPIVVTGLQSATEYTYTVTAINNYGTSAASAASAGVTATTVPQAPTIGTATGADQSATLTFTAGATGGSSITNYKYSTDNSTYTAFSPAQTTSPLTISGLTNGQSYSFYLKAVNANGDSAASAASNSVVPASGIQAFDSIATITTTSNQSSVTFNSITGTYRHLQIRMLARTNRSPSNIDGIGARINGDTGSNYNYTALYFNNNGASGANTANNTELWVGWACSSTTEADSFGAGYANFLDYTDTNKFKTVESWGSDVCIGEGSAISGYHGYHGSTWRSTNAITSITLKPTDGTAFLSGCVFALYGIKDAA